MIPRPRGHHNVLLAMLCVVAYIHMAGGDHVAALLTAGVESRLGMPRCVPLLRLAGGSSDPDAAAVFGGDDLEGSEAMADPDENFQEEDVRRGVRGTDARPRPRTVAKARRPSKGEQQAGGGGQPNDAQSR